MKSIEGAGTAMNCLNCPGCKSIIAPSDRFCGEGGLESEISKSPERKRQKIASERKYINVLLADISGYTSLSERLDPEEVKDLVGHIIDEIAKVVIKNGGHIEKFAGDQVMAVFGVPLAHGKDPVRAVKTADEIHQVVGDLSHQVQETIGQPLAVHIGINTGLVATGELNSAKAAHHIAGDTVNVASRLCTLAKAGETLVEHTTLTQVEGFSSFGPMETIIRVGKKVGTRSFGHGRAVLEL